ncbi:MAG: RNA polymerase sigma factor [Myxococcales bacterium]
MSSAAAVPGLVDHLFRHEAGRLAAALVRVLGPANLELAEDVVQETLCHALEVWKMGRVPDNPAAWLRAAARNRALDLLRRQHVRARLVPDVSRLQDEPAPAVDAAFTEDAVREEQLRMMFACCDARLQPPVQVALVLKLLCGFGVGEVAQAFLASPAAIEKRLARGKAALRRAGALADLADPRLARRLDAVLDALYLLFNEGYHGAHPELAVRADLCAEAIRLARLLAENAATAQPPTFALLALMCLHAARLPGRLDAQGALVPLEEQDRSAWDRALAAEGAQWLSRAVSEPPTALLLEAAIAAEHCFAPTFAETDWKSIAALYDALYAQRPTPVVALNRAIALAQVHGPERGLLELQALPGRERLVRYPFYPAALGELHLRAGHAREAADEFRKALRLARSPAERSYFQRKLAAAT